MIIICINEAKCNREGVLRSYIYIVFQIKDHKTSDRAGVFTPMDVRGFIFIKNLVSNYFEAWYHGNYSES